MTNIQKVADLAGVSIATVSRVINNSGKVSQQTRVKVEEAINSLNYVPNMLARNFRTAESKSILIMLTDISNLFYLEIIRGISDYVYEKGYAIFLSETKEDPVRQTDALQKIKNHIVDGAIIMDSTIKDSLLLSLEKRHPIVQHRSRGKDMPVPTVAVDDVMGGYAGARYLLEHGHRDIAFIGTNEVAKYNIDRMSGLMKCLREAGIRQDTDLIMHTELSFQNGAKAALRLMEGKKKPTAMFFVSDMLAIGAMSALTSKGLKIPGDVAVLGFDNISMCNFVSPGLTTVAQPMYDIGREAARLLLDRIAYGSTSSYKNVVFQPEIVERGSV